MKKIYILTLVMATLNCRGQERLVIGDMNGDGYLTVADVTLLTNTILGNSAKQYHECIGHEYVDLGLPSGTLWATCNVGAVNPEDFGSYFAWGEIYPKDTYSWSNYFDAIDSNPVTFKEYNRNSGKTEFSLIHDAARVHWGGDWHVPTYDQFHELFTKDLVNRQWATINGVDGVLFTSKTSDNWIFLPAAGQIVENGPRYEETTMAYWTSTIYAQSEAYGSFYYATASGIKWGGAPRLAGMPLRPVREVRQAW